MLGVADRRRGLFDAGWCSELLPEDSFYALLAEARERLVFERSLELAAELGLIEGAAERIVDSTPMLGAAAVQDTATLVRSGVRRLVDAVEASDNGAAEELAAGFASTTRARARSPPATGRDKASREALLAEVAGDALRAEGGGGG
jgi:hypothetical protein